MYPGKLFQTLYRFENSRVALHPLGHQHAESLLNFALDPSMWAYSSLRVHSEDSLSEYIDLALAERRAAQSYAFALLDPESGMAVGSSRFCRFSWPDSRMEIGFTWLGKPFQRSGMNRAAKYEMLRFAFEQLNMERVEFKTDLRNQASCRALEGIGAQREGVMRSHMVNWDGYRRDTVYFSILKGEWPALKTQLSAGLFECAQ